MVGGKEPEAPGMFDLGLTYYLAKFSKLVVAQNGTGYINRKSF